MSGALQTYNKCSKIIRLSLLITGLRPSDNPSILSRLIGFVHGFAVLAVTCVVLNFMCHNTTNLPLFFKAFSIVGSFLSGLQKMICFTIYRKQHAELHALFADTFDQDLKESQLRPSALLPFKLFYRPWLIVPFMMCGSSAIYCIAPLIVMAVQYIRHIDVILILPFPALYPWSVTENFWVYLLHLGFEFYAGTCLLMASALVDSLFGYYVFKISGQLRSLSYRIGNVKSNEDYCKVISACVVIHQKMLRCQDLFEHIYGPIVLWMLMVNSLMICALAYHLSRIDPRTAGPVVLVITFKLVQTLNYALLGTLLTTESDMFREAIYASDWAGSGEKPFMTDVLIMITQKPMVTNACSVSPISADMFVAVCNAAISYFFMLRTLDAGNSA